MSAILSRNAEAPGYKSLAALSKQALLGRSVGPTEPSGFLLILEFPERLDLLGKCQNVSTCPLA